MLHIYSASSTGKGPLCSSKSSEQNTGEAQGRASPVFKLDSVGYTLSSRLGSVVRLRCEDPKPIKENNSMRRDYRNAQA